MPHFLLPDDHFLVEEGRFVGGPFQHPLGHLRDRAFLLLLPKLLINGSKTLNVVFNEALDLVGMGEEGFYFPAFDAVIDEELFFLEVRQDQNVVEGAHIDQEEEDRLLMDILLGAVVVLLEERSELQEAVAPRTNQVVQLQKDQRIKYVEAAVCG